MTVNGRYLLFRLRADSNTMDKLMDAPIIANIQVESIKSDQARLFDAELLP